MYNLCFMARRPFDDLSPGIYKQIRKEQDPEANAIFITCDCKESEYIRKKFDANDKQVTVVELSAFMNEHWDEFTLEKLSYYEKKYDASPMWKYIYSDRFLIYRNYDYCVHTAAGLFAFWEHVFTTYKVDFYYDEVIATLFTYVAYLVGKKVGTHYYTLMLMRSVGMDLTHHYILNDPFEMIYDMPEDYATREYTPEQLKAADEFLAGFEEKHSKPAFMQFSGRKPKWKMSFFTLPFLWIRQRYFNPHAMDKGSYIYYKAYERSMEQIKFYFRYKASRKYYNKADLSKKFVYFPLHLQPEASTIVCAQKYEKQLYFLDNLAKSLPADTVIYCKEHYSFLGSRDNSFYRALKEYPNIVLIDPWEDSFQLIEHCECVATLTGTAGQEAMMLRRPVIMGGDILYENAPGVMRIDDIFGNYESAMANWKKPEREEIVKYLAAYMSCARPGNTYAMSDARLTDDNCRLLAKSMYDYFKEQKPIM
ncbi:capsular polysaccharide export protein, LipB/KpsS family [Pseudobutyrivibrio sp.]|uniref:capsular polysaccharide export protein, LipB/KpsS family n=1 Tax=Pseudobutyrivibrio sp. TaxID=2014367 RepID=UPI001D7951A1|nr:hypothetical protein [Pseudobutyrivibrio sp.]MBE5909976.1 hypothetical protein [Pseudobutyrivibrio sp.]